MQPRGLLVTLQRRGLFGCIALEMTGVLPKLKGSDDKVALAFKDTPKFSNERTNDKDQEQGSCSAFRRSEWKAVENRSRGGGWGAGRQLPSPWLSP